MYNSVTLIGHLGRDPEARQAANGTVVVNFSMATSRNWKDKTSGERKEEVEWHRCVVYDKIAEIVRDHAKKGTLVFVQGRLKYGRYTDKDGVERNSTDIVVEEFRLLHTPSADKAGSSAAPAPVSEPHKEKQAEQAAAKAEDMDW
jgi:single-strand DNA-binding protein